MSSNYSSYAGTSHYTQMPTNMDQRFVVLAGKKIHAFNTKTDSVEEYTISKDMYFIGADVIPNVGSPTSEHVRVALNKSDWTWMDVRESDIMIVNLTPIDRGFSNVKTITSQKELERKIEDNLERLKKIEESLSKNVSQQREYEKFVHDQYYKNSLLSKPITVALPDNTEDESTKKSVDKLITNMTPKWKSFMDTFKDSI